MILSILLQIPSAQAWLSNGPSGGTRAWLDEQLCTDTCGYYTPGDLANNGECTDGGSGLYSINHYLHLCSRQCLPDLLVCNNHMCLCIIAHPAKLLFHRKDRLITMLELLEREVKLTISL